MVLVLLLGYLPSVVCWQAVLQCMLLNFVRRSATCFADFLSVGASANLYHTACSAVVFVGVVISLSFVVNSITISKTIANGTKPTVAAIAVSMVG